VPLAGAIHTCTGLEPGGPDADRLREMSWRLARRCKLSRAINSSAICRPVSRHVEIGSSRHVLAEDKLGIGKRNGDGRGRRSPNDRG
jgi:hypothetical protein